ncbi:MAG TPA: hypothetical protein VIV60_34335, partial [Polyangiaceae bacterium]
MRILFDDSIDVEVFASSADISSGASGRYLSDRIRHSDFVVPVVVVTVTNERNSSVGQIELEFMPIDRPIHGSLSPHIVEGEAIRVRLNTASAAYALIRTNESELVGKRMNLCWTRF